MSQDKCILSQDSDDPCRLWFLFAWNMLDHAPWCRSSETELQNICQDHEQLSHSLLLGVVLEFMTTVACILRSFCSQISRRLLHSLLHVSTTFTCQSRLLAHRSSEYCSLCVFRCLSHSLLHVSTFTCQSCLPAHRSSEYCSLSVFRPSNQVVDGCLMENTHLRCCCHYLTGSPCYLRITQVRFLVSLNVL